MRDFTQAVGNFGFKYTLNWRGENYLFSFLSDRQRQWFEMEMKTAEQRSILESDLLNDAQREKELTKLRRDVAAKVYKFGGPRFKETLETPAGWCMFVQMLLVENHPDITLNDVESMIKEKPAEVTAIMKLIEVESTVVMKGMTPEQRETELADAYQMLIRPGTQGGLGMSMDDVTRLTDAQKIALVENRESKQDSNWLEDARKLDWTAADEALKRHKLVG